jgi:uncharacterized protein YukJ
MNQGNPRSGPFGGDNGVWQDGALFVHLPEETRWIAIFLAFQTQAWQTDDLTGHPLDDFLPFEAAGCARDLGFSSRRSRTWRRRRRARRR